MLLSERSRDVAIVRVDPSLVATRPALALACPPSRAPSLDDGQAIVSITVPHEGEKELVRGEVTALQPRRVETDVRLPFGGSGGPVFNDAGAVVGLTSMAVEPDSRPDDAAVVPTVFICEALAASLPMLSGAEPPAATRLPVDPARPYPAGALEDVRARHDAERGCSCDVVVGLRCGFHHAADGASRTAAVRLDGRPQSGRSPEAEERLGRLTEFGAWSDYFSSLPAVLIVRATPKMVEGFWKRLGREAARTQGAVLPAFKDFKTSFRHMRATCAGVEVTPIHPFVLEHRVNEKNVIREGLYVFDADAIGPQCGTVTLSLYSEAQPERADTLTPTRAVIDQIWNDFAPYRATGRESVQSSSSTSTATAGPTITIDSPHRINNDFNRGRSLSADDATISAPVVENGDASTIDAHTPIAHINAQPATPPDVASGTAIGTSAARIPAVDAKAETRPAIMQMTNAATSGVPTFIAACPIRLTASSRCRTPTNVTIPPTMKIVDQSILRMPSAPASGYISARTAPNPNAITPRSGWYPSEKPVTTERIKTTMHMSVTI